MVVGFMSIVPCSPVLRTSLCFYCSEMGDRKTKKAAPCTPEKQAVKTKLPPAQEKVGPSVYSTESEVCLTVGFVPFPVKMYLV